MFQLAGMEEEDDGFDSDHTNFEERMSEDMADFFQEVRHIWVCCTYKGRHVNYAVAEERGHGVKGPKQG